MIDPIGVNAVRSLGVDIANLSARLAVQSATIDFLIQVAEQIDVTAWDHQPVKDGDDVEVGFVTTLPGTEVEKVTMLLREIQGLKAG
jgi:hypothetical protein